MINLVGIKVTDDYDRELNLQKHLSQGELNGECHDTQRLGSNVALRKLDNAHICLCRGQSRQSHSFCSILL